MFSVALMLLGCHAIIELRDYCLSRSFQYCLVVVTVVHVSNKVITINL